MKNLLKVKICLKYFGYLVTFIVPQLAIEGCGLVQEVCSCKLTGVKYSLICDKKISELSDFPEKELKDMAQLPRSPSNEIVKKEITIKFKNYKNLPMFAFVNITNVATLDLSWNKIEIIKSGAFIGMTSLTYLDLTNNQINEIEPNTFQDLNLLANYLLLNNNQIKFIQNGSFLGLNQLRSLDLSHQQIEVIKIGAFSGMISLFDLNLKNNKIVQIEPNAFQNLKLLNSLGLTGNQINILQIGSFAGLDQLASLDLSGQQIKIVRSGTFIGLNTLKSLYLRNNNLTEIEPNAFFNLKLIIKDFYLDINQIKYIQNGSFTGLDQLTSLDLSQQQIEVIKCGTFSGMISLLDLNLRNNKIVQIEPDAFHNLKLLSSLVLIGNQINILQNCSFRGLSQIKVLDLSVQKIEIIKSGTFIGLNSLLDLDLRYNKLTEISSRAFQDLINLKKLSLNLNSIEFIRKKSFIDLIQLIDIDLSNQRIKKLSSISFYGLINIKRIQLNNNLINSILASDIRNELQNLTSLDVKFNKISLLDNNSFNELVKLNNFDLSNNYLSIICKKQFSFNENLEYLNLSNNQIKIIQEKAFFGLERSLLHMDLSFNRLDLIKSYNFVNFTQMKTLLLRSNSISAIEKDSLETLGNLSFLDLSDNCLFQIDRQLFRKQINLISMNLSFNLIKKLYFKENVILKRLTNLSMSNNLIENFLYSQLPDLAYLDLSSNLLLKEFYLSNQFIYLKLNGNKKMKLFQSNDSLLTNLKYFYLSYSLSSSIEALNLNIMPNLLELDLSSNEVKNMTNLEKYENKKLKSLSLRNIQVSFDSSLLTKFRVLESLDIEGCKQMKISQNNLLSRLIFLKKLCLNNLNMTLNFLRRQVDVTNLLNLEYLDISQNQIEIVSSFEKFKSKNLEFINFSYNLLNEFNTQNLFPSLNKIQVIDVSFNNVSKLNSFHFMDLFFSGKSFKAINLNANNISEIDYFTLNYALLQSESVDLSANRLNGFLVETNKHQVPIKLKFLSISNNNLEFIPSHLIRNPGQLIYISNFIKLDLSRNRLRNISRSDFLDLVNLQYLLLYQNQLVEIENGAFQNLINLVELDLSMNKIEKLDKFLFKNMHFLVNLNLSSNRLEYFDSELFANLKELIIFDISNNSIKSLSFLNGLTKLNDLNFNLNPISTFNQLTGLDSIANVYMPSELLNNPENVNNLIISFKKQKEVKRRFVEKARSSIQYFKAVNVIYLCQGNPLKRTHQDCSNILYLIKHGIFLNLKDDEDLEAFLNQCESFSRGLFLK